MLRLPDASAGEPIRPPGPGLPVGSCPRGPADPPEGSGGGPLDDLAVDDLAVEDLVYRLDQFGLDPLGLDQFGLGLLGLLPVRARIR